MQIGIGDARQIAGRHVPRPRGGAVRQKVLHPLTGGAVIAAAQREGGVLQLPLQPYAGEGMAVGEVGGGDVHQQRAVDVLPVPGVFTHAVGDHAPRFRRGGHYLTAGAHAERKGAAPVGQVAGQLVGGRRQGGVPRQPPVAGGVHRRLPVLDAHAHGKGLLLHGKPRAVQHFKGVSGAVSQRQHHLPCREGVKRPALPDGDGRHGPVLYGQTLQPCAEPDVRPGLQQLPPQGLQGDMELVGTHMGQRVGEDALRCAAGYQLLHDEAVPHVPCAGVQLAVGEGPGAALTELDVALRIQLTGGPETLYIPLPLLHTAAPLQQNGPRAAPRQHQRGKQARRPRAHHDGAHLRSGHGGGEGVPLRRIRRDPLVPAPAEQRRLLRGGDGHGVHESQPLPGVDGAAQHRQVCQHRRLYPQQPGALGQQRRLRLPRQQAQLVDPQHVSHLVFKKLKFPAET